jgi:hypothetical protein
VETNEFPAENTEKEEKTSSLKSPLVEMDTLLWRTRHDPSAWVLSLTSWGCRADQHRRSRVSMGLKQPRNRSRMAYRWANVSYPSYSCAVFDWGNVECWAYDYHGQSRPPDGLRIAKQRCPQGPKRLRASPLFMRSLRLASADTLDTERQVLPHMRWLSAVAPCGGWG